LQTVCWATVSLQGGYQLKLRSSCIASTTS
jgi:hypothetical protein